MTARTLAALALAGTLLASAALARTEPAPSTATPLPAPATPPTPEPVEPANPLRGPSITPTSATPAKPTLISRDFAGKLQPLDNRPEYVALDLLKLSDTERAAIDKLRTQRATRIAQVLQVHYAKIVELQGAGQSGDRATAMTKAREIRQAEPDLFEPPLADRFAPALTTENAATFKSLLNEYAQAELADRALAKTGADPMGPEGESPADSPAPARRRPGGAGRADPGNLPPALQAARRETMLTLREIGRSLKSTVNDRQARSEAHMKAIGASPELEEKIRQILRASGAANPGSEPTPEARAEMTRKIFALLTPEQRRQWIAAPKDR